MNTKRQWHVTVQLYKLLKSTRRISVGPVFGCAAPVAQTKVISMGAVGLRRAHALAL